ncbi:MAG TPA: Xaa-Pro peptidase family protein [Gaiellaceae bacterium]|nr:Xaa-Pro peptidase family protein [Gaiellaceae bacterium]
MSSMRAILRVVAISEQEYASRRDRLGALLDERGIDALFVAPSSDLEYLTGIQRDLPSFGNISYAHGWVAGAFLAPGQEPVFVLPRMVVDFHLDGVAPPGAQVVSEDGDGRASFAEAVRSLAELRRVALGQRVWAETVIELQRVVPGAELSEGSSLVNRLRRVKSEAELELMAAACAIARDTMDAVGPQVVPGVSMTALVAAVEQELRARGSRCPSFPTHIFTWGERRLDSGGPGMLDPLREGEVVLFDFGGVVEGYCSDFGRTIACGEPPPGYEDVLAAMLAAQEAGRAAARPGALACEVNAACRGPIEAAGLGEGFRHRMGHGIGLDVHEHPFLSIEDDTPLEAGMTFTDEPSILVDGSFGVRVEDVIVVADGAGRVL